MGEYWSFHEEVSIDRGLPWSSLLILGKDTEVEGGEVRSEEWGSGDSPWGSMLPLEGFSFIPRVFRISLELVGTFGIAWSDDVGVTIVGESITPRPPSRYLKQKRTFIINITK